MTRPYISPSALAKMTGDSAAIGARPADQAVALRVEPKVSTLRASILRAVDGIALAALIFTLCFAIPAIFGGS